MKKIFIFYLLYFFAGVNLLKAQSTFSYTYQLNDSDSIQNYSINQRTIQTADGNYVFSGIDHDKIFLVKFNSFGNIIKSSEYNYAGTGSLLALPDSGLLIAGSGMFVMRFDKNLNLLWAKKYVFTYPAVMGTSVVNPENILLTNDGNILVCGVLGWFNRDVLSGNLYYDYNSFATKINFVGDTLWTYYYHGSSHGKSFLGSANCSDGGYLLGGYDHHEAVAIKLANNGYFYGEKCLRLHTLRFLMHLFKMIQ